MLLEELQPYQLQPRKRQSSDQKYRAQSGGEENSHDTEHAGEAQGCGSKHNGQERYAWRKPDDDNQAVACSGPTLVIRLQVLMAMLVVMDMLVVMFMSMFNPGLMF